MQRLDYTVGAFPCNGHSAVRFCAQIGKSPAGLGLAVARELARLHSGDLTVSDTPGGGTTFTLSVPVPSEKRRAARHETRLS